MWKSEGYAFGREAEARVADHLVRSGYRIVGRNVHVGRYEIDVIAARGTLVVFCEVRARSTRRFGPAVESLSRGAKARRIRHAAATWMKSHGKGFRRMRVDAASVHRDGQLWSVRYYPGGLHSS